MFGTKTFHLIFRFFFSIFPNSTKNKFCNFLIKQQKERKKNERKFEILFHNMIFHSIMFLHKPRAKWTQNKKCLTNMEERTKKVCCIPRSIINVFKSRSWYSGFCFYFALHSTMGNISFILYESFFVVVYIEIHKITLQYCDTAFFYFCSSCTFP